MLQLEWPWLLLALPLPWLVRRYLPRVARLEEAPLRVPFLEDFQTGRHATRRRVLRRDLILASLAWLLLSLAAARPQWLGDPVELGVSGRDLMLAVDLSESMTTRDFILAGAAVDRLTALKSVAHDFIQRRVGDRLGLILFGSQAYLQVPLTFDRKTVETLLDEAVIGLAGRKTAIGDAIGLAVKRLRRHPGAREVLILLTDGANTAGEVMPIKAAELAAREGLVIYTIGIGADEMEVHSLFGSRRINPSADLDEITLSRIAKLTGGRYFRARDTDGLRKIYTLLDKLEPVQREQQLFRPRSPLFQWPLGLALLLSLALILGRLRPSPRRRQAA